MLPKILYKMKPPVSVRLISGHSLADKLFADYLFNEGSGLAAFDSSGRGHHGVITGAATWGMGQYGRAIDFDGSTGHIIIPDHDDFTPAGIPFSISVWIYMRVATYFQFVSKGVYNTDAEWKLYIEGNNKLYFRLFAESVDDCYIGRGYNFDMTALEDRWIHLVATSDGGKGSSGLTLCINGSRVDDVDSESNPGSFEAVENFNHDVLIGKSETRHSSGLIGRVMFWRRVLTVSDIKKLFAIPFCMYERRRRSLVTI